MSLPKLYEHSTAVYAYMKERVNTEDCFSGNIQEMLKELVISNSYYSNIFKYLKTANHITQVRRGGGGSLSVFKLNSPPDMESYADFTQNNSPQAKLVQEQVTLTEVLTKFAELKEAVFKLALNLSSLEKRVAEIEKDNNG